MYSSFIARLPTALLWLSSFHPKVNPIPGGDLPHANAITASPANTAPRSGSYAQARAPQTASAPERCLTDWGRSRDPAWRHVGSKVTGVWIHLRSISCAARNKPLLNSHRAESATFYLRGSLGDTTGKVPVMRALISKVSLTTAVWGIMSTIVSTLNLSQGWTDLLNKGASRESSSPL